MYQTGTASSYTDLLDKLNTFLTSSGSASAITFTGAGNGRLTGYKGGSATVAEQFTLTATSPTTFNVVGSVSGNLGVATVGTLFSTNKLAFTIAAGSTPFVAGDTFKLYAAPKWSARRSTPGSEYVWEAPGHDGLGGIFTGMQAYSNVASDYFNLRVAGFTGFTDGVAFASQPGATDSPSSLALWQYEMPYWFVANGRRAIVVVKVSNVYQAAYLGLAEPYLDPAVFPYPLVAAGSMIGALRWSNTTDSNHVFTHSRYTSTASDTIATMRMRLQSGTWRGFFVNGEPRIWPDDSTLTLTESNVGGGFPLLPVVLTDSAPLNIYAKLDGVYRVPGFALGAETVISVGQSDYIAFQDVYRAGRGDYFAIGLD